MRTPPPVLPPRDEQSELPQSWLQRQGPDGSIALKVIVALGLIFAATLVAGIGAAKIRGLQGGGAIAFALAMATVLTGGAGVFILKLVGAGGVVAQAIIFPTGASSPYEEQFSYQQALAARGDVDGALASYEAVISEQPDVPLPRLRAAELHARAGRDPERAAVLFRSVRDMPAAAPRDALYASNRLVDLYDGPLGDPGRALVELRRIIERYPGSPAAVRARAALPGLKARLAEGLEEG
ncbi:MAG: hypothetical protein JWL95_1694 [Gemmatimonadetes bacterium]|nr:hypothetical protein [Gemmatimonadota bacterium]